MPLYFAYGSNMDRDAMHRRCPRSRPLGRARLARHRFFIMSSGHASVRRDPRLDVPGVLYELTLADVPALDRYEEVGRGLYQKITQFVLRESGAPVQALVYVGCSTREGVAQAAYLESIIAAARGWDLPEPHIAHLVALVTDQSKAAAEHGAGWRAIRLKGI